MIARLINSCNFKIPNNKKKRYKITVAAGAGQQGEGEFGGIGGLGEVKVHYILTSSDIVVKSNFITIASKGASNQFFFGGKAGKDISCEISTEDSSEIIYCKGGAGGGAGGCEKKSIGCNGGGYLERDGYMPNHINGGKGLDGPIDCIYNNITKQTWYSEPLNYEDAFVLIEEI